jgi:amino acid adenylation domain-containing protein
MSATPYTLSDVLRRSARRFADRPALKGVTTALTYAELDGVVDALAVRLRTEGVEPGQRVGLCVERGPLPLVASAALMRLGCAYVPLDPRHPAERLRHILSDAGLTVCLCDLVGRATLAETSLALIDVSGADLVWGGAEPAGDPLPGPDPDADAYVMYTSGSTGRPKGVAITHANLSPLLADALPLFPYDEAGDEVWPLQHAHGFDISVWEMWAGIAVGATLVAVEGQARHDPEYLAELLLRYRVTWLHIVPSVFNQLAEVVLAERLRVPLRGVTFCGEAINYRALRTWTDAHPGRRPPIWYNVYGITETTVYNTARRITARDIELADPATPIGVGYAHSPVVVLDEDFRPAPAGRTGEIFIGGGQVARGYLNSPELTADRFLRLSGRPGRWYRTGDFAHQGADGIHYVGRKDDQVKIRGFRIELGELEHAARTLPWVADAAAVVRTSARDEPMLAMFVVTVGDVPDVRDRLRTELTDRLPPHMMPTQVLSVPELPQNANGKRDRRAMRELLAARA